MAAKPSKKDFLNEKIEHIDITSFDAVPIIDQMSKMSFQARNLARATYICRDMLKEDVFVILTLAGSLISAGCRKVLVDMLKCNMIDAVVSTGANMIDMDLLEALGYRHYKGDITADDEMLRQLHIDRIYDTYIDEDELRDVDMTMAKIAGMLEPRAHSSREIVQRLGKYLSENDLGKDSFLRVAYEKAIPIFIPAFADCAAGFGFVHHQVMNPEKHASHDSVADFRELTQLKVSEGESGMMVICGGYPKNFAADVVVAAEVLGYDVAMHKYAVQLTVADERDGALSGSTLKEAHSWGKVDSGAEQMVWAEASLTFPLMGSYLYHEGSWKKRKERRLNDVLATAKPLKDLTGGDEHKVKEAIPRRPAVAITHKR